ncbi:hypothetical protein FF124_13525 [Martelella lutilitoris]|uniref:Uncharacterized protein n=1 Tax=Martelella lutilitoris TaxID=2583532 RepID=A0A5C4JPQ3_9HYPH|nr:hypothetical protein [Martelella lutilitoris]TNB47191.1 hypothetical protein FF124_13525 [Martelella lutilitoris]
MATKLTFEKKQDLTILIRSFKIQDEIGSKGGRPSIRACNCLEKRLVLIEKAARLRYSSERDRNIACAKATPTTREKNESSPPGF